MWLILRSKLLYFEKMETLATNIFLLKFDIQKKKNLINWQIGLHENLNKTNITFGLSPM